VQFRRQVPLLDFIVDFYCQELKLAIEIDGDSHDFKYDDDAKREGKLEKLGITIIRFSDEDVKNNVFSVRLSIEETVRALTEEVSTDTPKVPSRGPSNVADLPIKNSFGKKEKLKSHKHITQLFEEGKGISNYPLKLMYIPIPSSEVSIKAGVTVSKRNFKSAVHRNRIKRLLREAYRLNKGLVFNNTDAKFAFLFLYLGKEMPSFELLEEKMKLVLHKFKVNTDEKNTP
ncbi:MAG: ribonuclease P protein component, partial [Maribacter sp.]